MDYTIRQMRPPEYPLLEDFLYKAIFVPEGFEGDVPRTVIYDDPKCRATFESFGSRPDDRALVVEVDGRVVGACWVRTTDEYGHLDDATPSFAIALDEPYRNQGLGHSLMQHLLDDLRDRGYARASLSVQKANPALHLYERLGFRIIGNGADETEWLMTCTFGHATSLAFHRLTAESISLFIELRIAQLLKEGAEETVDLRPALNDYYTRHLADDSFVSWLAVDGERVIATSGLSIVEKPPYFGCPSGRIGLISSMYTAPAYRHQGIARDLLCRIVNEARQRHCGAIQITASDAGVPLYESVGFTKNDNFRQLTLR